MSKRDKKIKKAAKLTSMEKRYLNSKSRAIKRLVFGLIEYVIMFALMIVIATYLQYQSLDNIQEKFEGLKSWFQPGGMLFNALVAYLPILLLGCVGCYFGEGTYGKMLFGIGRCVAIIVWLVLIFQGASTSLSMAEMTSGSSVSIEDLTIGLGGLVKFAVLVLSCSILIPIGEFAGARKRHKEAYAHRMRLKEGKVTEHEI